MRPGFNICSLVKFLLLCVCVAEVSSRRCLGCTGAPQQRKPEVLANLANCCACGRPVYNVTFIGKWDKLTQPRHHPGPMASWSDMIGCTHNNRYVMWRYGGLASLGVQRLSEWGSTAFLEEEMRNQGKNVQSIIKTRGIHKGVGASSTLLKASRKHHFLSMIARIKPSPDWSVGVDRLDLCNSNCTWKKLIVQNLFPWDAGTDDGIGFTSVNTKSNPQQPIRRITADLHNHTSASFYRKRGMAIRPMAQLRVELLRIHGACVRPQTPPFPPKPPRMDCVVTHWTQWSACSVTCGKQYRARTIQTPPSQDGMKCPELTEKRKCSEKDCRGNGELGPQPSIDCEVSAWSNWSLCRPDLCKPILRSRTRLVIRRPQNNGKKCPTLVRWRKCKLRKCRGDMIWQDKCHLSEWTAWTQCTKPCNSGKKFRYRKITSDGANHEECRQQKLKERKRCNTKSCNA